ncbi:hypothetical protein PIB30_031668 [Stylosanthes scabra]|uniref:Transposase (Putative), gypsy type n=1 Tax=Stylosanthes scabra TaxID=79078 RepID=A0ABU6YAT4_9FABA|nr:hypothetical protein [Stylosanthes scabra]
MADNPDGRPEAVAAEAAQMPRELSTLYRWVSPDVLGTPSILSQAYIDELKGTGVIFGGGDLEWRYKVEAAHRGERASIRCFELVIEWLQLPQEPEVFMCLFIFYSANTQGKTKKGYMSVRPTKYRKIFGLFEGSFHDFKGRYFKILPVGTHRPFWLSLEGDGRFPSYWTDRAGFDVAPVTYKGLRAEQKDTVDVLTTLFAKNNLAPKALLGLRMAGNDVTLNCLRGLVRPLTSAGVIVSPTPAVGHGGSGPSSSARVNTPPVGPTPDVIITPKQGSSNDGGRGVGVADDVASTVRIEQQPSPPSSNRRSVPVESSAAKRQRTETSACEFGPLDRSFDASKFIADRLLGPKAQVALQDYDPVESFRWVQWAMLKSATIMKSVEPRLIMMDEVEGHNQRLVGDLKALNLQKMVLEEQLKDVTAAKGKAEEDLKGVEKNLEVLKQKKEEEIATFQGRIKELESEVLKLKDSVVAEKARADVAEGKIPGLEKQRDENAEDAKAAVTATEAVLKAQLAVLIPEFDVSRIGFFKEIVDGQVVDIPMDPPPS